jgi:hypothetical protein
VTARRREWDLTSLLEQATDLPRSVAFALRCKDTAVGHGRYIKDVPPERHFAEVFLEVKPGDSLAVVLGNEWPRETSPLVSADLDRALVHGVVAELAARADLEVWNCRIRITGASCGEDTPAIAVKVAAGLAVRDMLARAAWTPHPPTGPEAA